MGKEGIHEDPSLAEKPLVVEGFWRKENNFSSVMYLLVNCPFGSKYNSIPSSCKQSQLNPVVTEK